MNIDSVVDVQISVSKTVASATRFGHMLIICPAPKTPGAATTPPVGAYSTVSALEELTTAGFTDADPVIGAVKMILKAKTLPDIIYVAVQQNVSDGVEKIATTLQRAIDYTNDFWGVCPVGIQSSDLQALSEAVEVAKPGIFLFVASTSIGDVVVSGEPERTRVFHQTQDTDYANVGEAAAILALAPGSATFQFQNIPGLAGQSLTQSEISSMEKINTACYVTLYGNNVVYGGKTLSGEWADVVLFKDWLIDRIQRKIAELFIKRDKVPFTDAGITMIQSNMISALEEGRTAGGIADDETDNDGNVTPGFTTSVPRGRALDEAKRAQRVLEDCKFEARLAGAIHSVVVRGNLVS